MTLSDALNHLVRAMKEVYGDMLAEIILYGSVARGTGTDESDVDIALLLYPGTGKEQFRQMINRVSALELMCDKVLSVVPIDYARFLDWENTLPYYSNIRKEGIVLWQAA